MCPDLRDVCWIGGFGFTESVFLTWAWTSFTLLLYGNYLIVKLFVTLQSKLTMELWWDRDALLEGKHSERIFQWFYWYHKLCWTWFRKVLVENRANTRRTAEKVFMTVGKKMKNFWGLSPFKKSWRDWKGTNGLKQKRTFWPKILQKHDLNVSKLFLLRVKWGTLKNRNGQSKVFELVEKLELIQWPGRALLFMSWSSGLIEPGLLLL